ALGTDGTWPSPGGATSGFLIRHDGFSVWADLGTGTFAALQQHIDATDVGAVFVSHAHPDHFTDLYSLFYFREYSNYDRDPLRGLPLFCPPGFFDRVSSVLGTQAASLMAQSLDITEVEAGDSFEAGPLRVSTAPMAHPVPTLGIRAEADGAAIAYTGDTGPTDALTGLARDTDLFLAEASWQGSAEGFPPDLHMTAIEAGEAAARAGAASLLLTHLRPDLDPARSVEEARSAFDGEVVAVEKGWRGEAGR
ncbi:MAG: MBL fold metallo-hydrolase, partial [Actinomycetota bacterium]|nr:MBL fold metallo-hydrolase [Actinomycetota bacterium]